MPDRWVLPDRRSAVRLPRPRQLSPPQESFPPITFSVKGWPGVRVEDVLNHAVMVDCPYDMPMAHLGWRSTVVNLEVSSYVLDIFLAHADRYGTFVSGLVTIGAISRTPKMPGSRLWMVMAR